MTRFKAFGLHLAGSLTVIACIFLALRQIWYPGQLFYLANGLDLMKILVPVDVILGPLLTLLVFDVAKKSLKRDLLIILLVQLSFLFYGLYIIFSVRPAYLTLLADNLYMVTANNVDTQSQLKATEPQFKTLPLWGHETVSIRIPEGKISNEMQLRTAVGEGLQFLPEHYLKPKPGELRKAARQPADIANLKPEQLKKAQEYLASHPGQKLGFIPLYIKLSQYLAIVDMDREMILGVL